MPSSSNNRTYRVWGLPPNVSIPESERILSDLFDQDGQETKPKIHSLGFDPYETEGSATKVATATFGHTPVQLAEGDEWNFPARSVTIDTHFRGFTPLNCEKEATADIIAVSGLSSHPFGSWKTRGGQFMWLRDHIAQKVPGARVLLYGYDTRLLQSESSQNIDDIAKYLCVGMDSIRRLKAGEANYEPRPIVFIAHSLGGLVVKEAIYQMFSHGYLDNFLSVYGLIFFGVPNQGIKISHWLPMVENRPNVDLINNLKPDASYLRLLRERFGSAIQYPGSKVVSVCEMKRSRTAKEESPGCWDLTGKLKFLVSRESAFGPYPPELDQLQIGFNQNRSDLPKFPSPSDNDYKIVYRFIQDFHDSSAGVIQERFAREATTREIRGNFRSGGYSFTCQKCNKKFDSRISLFQHLKGPGKNECYRAAIHYSIANGQVGVAKVLLSEGSNVETRDMNGEVPLHWAAQYGEAEIAAVLLDQNANHTVKEKTGKTPLHIAVIQGNTEVAELLLARGANVEAKCNDGGTPLHHAATSGRMEMAKLLLVRGANIDSKRRNDTTPLHDAVEQGQMEVARLLLIQGASIEAKCNDSHTPLLLAALNGQTDMAKLLLCRGASIEAKCNHGCTPLHFAASKGKTETARLLLDRGANIEAKRGNGKTPLHDAAGQGHVDVAGLLLHRNANKEARCEHGNTPLHFAASKGKKEMISLLLKRGANTKAKCVYGRTPLYDAATQGHMDVTKILLGRGASIRQKGFVMWHHWYQLF